MFKNFTFQFLSSAYVLCSFLHNVLSRYFKGVPNFLSEAHFDYHLTHFIHFNRNIEKETTFSNLSLLQHLPTSSIGTLQMVLQSSSKQNNKMIFSLYCIIEYF